MTSDFASGHDWLPVLSRTLRTFAVVGLVAAGLTLAGCGRKAGLDAPPGASLTDSDETAPADNSAKAASSNLLAPAGTGKAPVASRGENKRILLDGLLN